MSADESMVRSDGAGAVGAEVGELRQLLGEFAAMKRQLREQSERLERQEAELAQLRQTASQAPELAGLSPTPIAEATLSLPEGVGSRSSRRGLLTGAAAAFSALGIAGALAGTARAQTPTPPAQQPHATGDPVILGQVNVANPANTTVIANPLVGGFPQTAPPQQLLLQVDNGNFQLIPAPGRVLTPVPANTFISIAGTSSKTALNGSRHVGVYGAATQGIGVVADGLWPLVIVPGAAGAAPPTADNAPTPNTAPHGAAYFQEAGPPGSPIVHTLWFNFGEAGWRRVADESFAGVLRLITPTRVVDTRVAAQNGTGPIGFDQNGNAIAANPIPGGTTARYLINGKSFNNGGPIPFLFPIDVRGVLANVTIVGPVGGGFVTVFPGFVPDAQRPNASTLNPVTSPAFNFTAVQVAPTGAAPNYGTIAVFTTVTLDVVVDVVGLFL